MGGESKLRRTIRAQLRLSRLGKCSASSCTRLESLAREHTEAALNVIIQVMEKTQDERTRLMAARMLRDRGWGKPTQTL